MNNKLSAEIWPGYFFCYETWLLIILSHFSLKIREWLKGSNTLESQMCQTVRWNDKAHVICNNFLHCSFQQCTSMLLTFYCPFKRLCCCLCESPVTMKISRMTHHKPPVTTKHKKWSVISRGSPKLTVSVQAPDKCDEGISYCLHGDWESFAWGKHLFTQTTDLFINLINHILQLSASILNLYVLSLIVLHTPGISLYDDVQTAGSW